MSDIFISHVEEDAEVALQIASGLEKAGYTTWYYERDSLIGPKYLLQVSQEIEQAKAMLVIISPDSLSSDQVTNEIVSAYENRKIFVPLLRNISHGEFQQRRPDWKQALGAYTSSPIPKELTPNFFSRIIKGLQYSGIQPNVESRMGNKALTESKLPTENQADVISRKEVYQHSDTIKRRKLWRRFVIIGVPLLAILILIFGVYSTFKKIPIDRELIKNMQISNENSLVLQAQSSSPVNVKLTRDAWEAYNGEKYEQAIEKAQECIDEFEIKAMQEQEELKKNSVPPHPLGTVSDKEKKEILNRGILNDVATCWYIIGRSFEERGHRYKDEAIQAYNKAAQFSHARTYDHNGNQFWSPAQEAITRASFLEKVQIAKSTPNTAIESAKEPSALNKTNTDHPDEVSMENLNNKIVEAEKLPDEKENKQTFEEQLVDMEFVFVKGGEYAMGCGDWAGDCYENEKPVHTVKVDDYYMGKYEVTVGQWKKFIQDTGYEGGGKNCVGTRGMAVPEYFTQDDNHPVVCVSWNEAKAFVDWLSKKTGKNYRLPTEVEWEFAARSRGQNVRYGTKTGDLSHDLANYDGTGGKDQWEHTSPVGSFPANPLGLHDMAGNVAEWCSDWYSRDYYKHSPVDNPEGPKSGNGRAVRGGSYRHLNIKFFRCVFRNNCGNNDRFSSNGFRVSRTP